MDSRELKLIAASVAVSVVTTVIAIPIVIRISVEGLPWTWSKDEPVKELSIASSQQLDNAVPNPEFCRQWGASALVTESVTFATLNPVSGFVSQPRFQVGCVVKKGSIDALVQENVVSAAQVRECTAVQGTFAFTGSITEKPRVRCVTKSDSATEVPNNEQLKEF